MTRRLAGGPRREHATAASPDGSQRRGTAVPTTSIGLKHERVADVLAGEIRSGRVEHGARLPGEHSLARRFSVSRTTIREALSALGNAGLIATRSGKGSFVLFDGHRLDDPLGWAHALASGGVASSVHVVSLHPGDPLGRPGAGRGRDATVVVERVRELADGTPVSYERSTIPSTATSKDLSPGSLDGASLTDVLRRSGLVADHGDQRLAGHRISEGESALLRRPAGTWFLRALRTSFAADGRFVEHVESLLDPTHFELCSNFASVHE